MTVSNTTSYVDYPHTSVIAGVGLYAAMQLRDAADVRVCYGGDEEVLAAPGVDYNVTVTTDSGGGIVGVSVIPTTAFVAKLRVKTGTVSIYRDTPPAQELDLLPNRRIPEPQLTRALDKVVMIAGDAKREGSKAKSIVKRVRDTVADHAAKFAEFWPRRVMSAEGDGVMVMPRVASRRNKLLGFSSGGGPVPVDLQIVTVPGNVIFSSAMTVKASQVPAQTNFLRTAGYYASGDGGAALYQRGVQQPGAIQSADGAWWNIAENILDAKMFGVVGDGVTDDAPALNDWAYEVGRYGKLATLQGPGPFRINSKVQFITRRKTATRPPNVIIHFTDFSPFTVIGMGSPVVQAGAAIDAMFEFVYDGLGNLGPFGSLCEGICFDGNNLAVTGVWSNWTMHMRYERNRFWRLERGIHHTGYGGFKAMGNKFWCKHAIYLLAGGGDSVIEANDFYAAAHNAGSIYLGYWGGNLVVLANTFTNGDGGTKFTNAYAIQMDGASAPVAQEIRHVTITANEFCGYTYGIYAKGKGFATRNIWQVTVRDNHVTQYGEFNDGALLYAEYCDDWLIDSNFVNTYYLAGGSLPGIEMYACMRTKIHHNKFQKHNVHQLVLRDCQYNEVTDNEFQLWGLENADGNAIAIERSAIPGQGNWKNLIKDNYFQAGAGLENRIAIREWNMTNSEVTYAHDNEYENVQRPHLRMSSQSVLRWIKHGPAIPTGGYFYVGDMMINTNPLPGDTNRGWMGWVCGVEGPASASTWFPYGALSPTPVSNPTLPF